MGNKRLRSGMRSGLRFGEREAAVVVGVLRVCCARVVRLVCGALAVRDWYC